MDNLPPPRVVIEATSPFVTTELLDRSNPLAILPRNVAASDERVGQLSVVPINLNEF